MVRETRIYKKYLKKIPVNEENELEIVRKLIQWINKDSGLYVILQRSLDDNWIIEKYPMIRMYELVNELPQDKADQLNGIIVDLCDKEDFKHGIKSEILKNVKGSACD